MNKLSKIIATGLVALSLNTYADDCPSLSGEVIIGTGKESDFTTISEAMDALRCGGASGPVTFMLESGTYKERLVISSIPGIDAFNPLVFQSASGNNTDVVISYAATDATVVVNASFVSFENITIDHSKGTYGNCMRVEGKSSNLMFRGVLFDGVEKAAAGETNATVYFAPTATKSNISFEDCEVNFGSIGICKKGMSSMFPDTRTTISGTLFFGQTEAGMTLSNEEAPLITSNVVSTSSSINGYKAIYLDEVSNNVMVTKNILNTANNAMGLVMNNCMASATNPGQIINNTMALQGNTQALGISMSGNTDNHVFNFNRVKMAMNADNASTQGYYSNSSTGTNINMMNSLFIDMNTGVYTVMGNSYKDFFNQLPGQSNQALTAKANSFTMEKVSGVK
ncbi:MAG: hypothetical protein V4615_14380 [Bacteroidota bacterium]